MHTGKNLTYISFYSPPSEPHHCDLCRPPELQGRGFSRAALQGCGDPAHHIHLDQRQRDTHWGQTCWWWVTAELISAAGRRRVTSALFVCLLLCRRWSSAYLKCAEVWWRRILLHCREPSRTPSETHHPHRHRFISCFIFNLQSKTESVALTGEEHMEIRELYVATLCLSAICVLISYFQINRTSNWD